MPSRLPFFDESAPPILADGLLRASSFLQVGWAGELLTELKVLLSFLRHQVYWWDARQDQHSTRWHSDNDLRVFEGSPVHDQQSLGLFRGHFQASAIQHDVPNEWTHPWRLRGATCHLFFERLLVALVYHPPVKLMPRCRCSTSRYWTHCVCYIANQRAESLALTSSSSCFSGDVHHCLDDVNCGPAFSKAELVFRETVFADHVTL